MASRDEDDDSDTRVARTTARWNNEAAYFDEKDAAEERAKAAMIDADREREAMARVAVARAQRAAAARPRVKTKYEGPDPDRANRGNFVSKEELTDFQRRFGANLTLRDLLNADRGRGPSAAMSAARGVQDANIAPKQPDPYQDPSRGMEGVAARQREMMRPGRDAIEGVYPETALIPAAKLVQMAARASMAAKPVQAARAAKATEKAERREPPFETPRPNTVLRRMQERAGRNAQEEYVNDIMSRGAEMGMKKGGKVKAYAKGGSVRGGGCEQRGLKKCKIY